MIPVVNETGHAIQWVFFTLSAQSAIYSAINPWLIESSPGDKWSQIMKLKVNEQTQHGQQPTTEANTAGKFLDGVCVSVCGNVGTRRERAMNSNLPNPPGNALSHLFLDVNLYPLCRLSPFTQNYWWVLVLFYVETLGLQVRHSWHSVVPHPPTTTQKRNEMNDACVVANEVAKLLTKIAIATPVSILDQFSLL